MYVFYRFISPIAQRSHVYCRIRSPDAQRSNGFYSASSQSFTDTLRSRGFYRASSQSFTDTLRSRISTFLLDLWMSLKSLKGSFQIASNRRSVPETRKGLQHFTVAIVSDVREVEISKLVFAPRNKSKQITPMQPSNSVMSSAK